MQTRRRTLAVAAALACLACLCEANVKYKIAKVPPVPHAPPFPPPQKPITLPIQATFTLPSSVCTSIIQLQEPSYFDFLVANDTASAWTGLYPTAPIAPDNVLVEVYAYQCVPTPAPAGRKLQGRAQEPITVTVHGFCYLPPGTTDMQAQVAAGSLVQETTVNFITSSLAKTYNITQAMVTTNPSFSLVFCTGTTSNHQVACLGGAYNGITIWNGQWLPTNKSGH